MAQDKRQTTKIPKWANKDYGGGLRLDAASYIGVVKNNVDPARSGRVQIWIPDFGGDDTNPANWRTVSYASPYFGATYQPDSSKNNSFTGVNHTYGMWMVPPDIGNQVLCTFVNGDPDRGYWFACINPTLSHYMVPGIAAGNKVDKSLASDEIKPSLLPDTNVPPQKLPVAEFNENVTTNNWEDFINLPKPIHEYQAKILFKQGLDRDAIRGAVTSSSQRETPSHAFGISTPGRPNGNDPADNPTAYEAKLAAGKITEDQYAVKSRKGGHTFVMDDGDTMGKNNILRFRSAGGHQVLMSDSERTMYIANSEGSVWIELTGSGHLHIYSAAGVNVHAEDDINFHSGKNVNIHAEKTINLNAINEVNIVGSKINISAVDKLLAWGGKTTIGSGGNMVIGAAAITMGADGQIAIDGSKINLNGSGGGNTTTGGSIETFKHADTGFDDKTKLWNEIPAAAESIVSVLPQHEPWTRQAAAGSNKNIGGAAPTKTVTSAECAPKTGGKPGTYALPKPNGNNLDKGTVQRQPVPWSTDTPFLDKVKSVAGQFNANYMDMLAIMYHESAGTMDPAIVNSIGATGLIQFMPTTASGLGTSTSALAQLGRVEQMDWVAKFFSYNRLSSKAPTPSLSDMYCCVFWPAAVGKPDDYVIAAVGSSVWKQNASLQSSGGGPITVASVGAAAAGKLAIVQQCLANAGATTDPTPSGVDTSTPVADGTGNVISSGTNTTSATDLGIKAAAGQSITGDTCPGEWLHRADCYNPPGGIGTSAPKFTQAQVKAMLAELGYFESKWDYSKDTGIKIGKYQEDGSYLVDAGYIKFDAFTQYPVNTVLSNPESWTNKDGINSKEAFFENKSLQDQLQYNEFVSNYSALLSNGGIKSTDDICTAAGMLFVAHQFASAAKAKEWRDKGTLTDREGRNGSVYFNHGRYAIDVLAAGGATTGTTAAGPTGTNTTGVDPEDVFIFQSSGSGTRAAFDALDGSFQNAIIKAAQAYKDKTGSKITVTSAYRSQADQDALYQRWVAAGGHLPDTPTAGGLTTPAKTSKHSSGLAIDSSQAAVINNTINLADFGLKWGGTFSTSDPVHIQLATAP